MLKNIVSLSQLNPEPVYDSADHSDHQYSTVYFSEKHTNLLYSTIQQDQFQEQEHIPYAIVHLRSNATPD